MFNNIGNLWLIYMFFYIILGNHDATAIWALKLFTIAVFFEMFKIIIIEKFFISAVIASKLEFIELFLGVNTQISMFIKLLFTMCGAFFEFIVSLRRNFIIIARVQANTSAADNANDCWRLD